MNINNIQCHGYAMYESLPQSVSNLLTTMAMKLNEKHVFGAHHVVRACTCKQKQQCTTALPLACTCKKRNKSDACTGMWSCKPALTILQRGAPKRRASSQRHEGDSELPSEILFARHSQMSSSQIFFARSMSTRWRGVHTLFKESFLDFKTNGGHWCGVQSLLSFRVIALASTTRR